jgi:hypothetical protein
MQVHGSRPSALQKRAADRGFPVSALYRAAFGLNAR